MAGRDRWVASAPIERPSLPLKYEGAELKGYADDHEAAQGIAGWFAFCNAPRPPQALVDRANDGGR